MQVSGDVAGAVAGEAHVDPHDEDLAAVEPGDLDIRQEILSVVCAEARRWRVPARTVFLAEQRDGLVTVEVLVT
ncbi:MAG TPA: hypothetical protein VIH21_00970, partial [Dehalococcoidia bacterium]